MRPRLLTLAVAVVAATTVAVAAPAAAVPATAAAQRPVLATPPATITLITGDTVTVTTSGGRTSVDVTPRPGNHAFTYRTEQRDDGYHLIPDEAAPHVASGLLDRRLFNLTYLAANGYTDATVPVIVRYRQELSATELDRKASMLQGTTERLALPSVNGTALDAAADGTFWQSVQATRDVEKVWLDAKVEALDDVSNAQIGAPQAWAAGHDGTGATVGVIDTGVDRTHPDLASQVVAARNFVEPGFPGGGAPDDVTDRHGHGTHVASTVAGSGAASAGRYKGVAPGTRLVVAKALDDSGSGTDSAIIAAMEWTATQVDVVSMSLGSNVPTDGTDPLSTAVDELTAESGALFVIAAGNSGPGRFTIAAPGAADAALTVGAVDSDDRMADFSSRGPRVGDLAIKPEITAPGVGIVAARAAGTAMGSPLDDRYTAASGTSMATPHVAATAGILAAAHQDWKPAQLKAALTGATHDTGVGVYDQGAGRLDLGRAATQPVVGDVSNVFARVAYPYEGQALTRTITYRNTGTSPVTLDLSVTMNPAGIGTLSRDEVTVEPGATASVDLTLDPASAAAGWYEGRVTATGDGQRLAVPVALWLQAEQHTVRLRLVGDPSWSMSSFSVGALLMSDTDPRFAGEPSVKTAVWRATGEPNVRETTMSLARGGTYSLSTAVHWTTADRVRNSGQVVEPELTVDGDRTIVLDATRLTRVNVGTEQPSVPVMTSYFYYQTSAAGVLYTGGSVLSYPAISRGGYWISPARTPSIGQLGFLADETRIAPQVTVTAPGWSLHPRYVTDRPASLPMFTQDRRVGFVNEQDLRAGKDVRGKLVFLTPAPLATFQSDMDLAMAGGAAGVLTNNYLAWAIDDGPYAERLRIPLLWLDDTEAAALAKRLPRSALVRARVTAPYEYKAVHYLRDRIPDRIDFRPRDRDLAKVDTTYHARFAPPRGKWGPVAAFTEVQHTFVPGQILSVRGSHEFVAPATRTEYYTVVDDATWYRNYQFSDYTTDGHRYAASWRGFTRGSSETEDWHEAVLPAQQLAGPHLPATGQTQLLCDGCRQGDRLRLRSLGTLGFGHFTDAGDPSHHYLAEPGAEEVHLYRDGTEVMPAHDAYGLPYYTVPADAATYRLTDVYTNGFPGPHGGGTITTDWTFRSGRPGTPTVAEPYTCIDTSLFNDTQPCAWQPLIQLTYDLDLASDDITKAGRPFTFTVTPRVGPKTTGLRDLKVWISADAGTKWTRAAVSRGKDGTYRVAVTNPRAAGPIAIRAEATDRTGNKVSQTILDAYQVR